MKDDFVLRILFMLVLCMASPVEVRAQSSAPGGCVRVAAGEKDEPCLVPGSGTAAWFKDCTACPEMVVVPSGSLIVAGTAASADIESPTGGVAVTFAEPIAVGRFAVTFAEWDACAADGGCGGYQPADQGWGRGNRPVINVSWDDAQVYLAWLSKKTGKTYRLLSGPEREYVARAGTTTPFWSGATLDIESANVDLPVQSNRPANATGDVISKVRHQTLPVNSFAPNPWGLFNVHGNVWEWTSDCVADRGPELVEEPIADESAKAPSTQQAACDTRASRGGSWLDFPHEAESASFVGFSASSRNYAQGFRVARRLP